MSIENTKRVIGAILKERDMCQELGCMEGFVIAARAAWQGLLHSNIDPVTSEDIISAERELSLEISCAKAIFAPDFKDGAPPCPSYD